MNTNLNTNKLIEKLNVILQMEESKFNGIHLPNTDEEHDMFSRGYAEGISDVIYLLKQSIEEYKHEVVDDDAWMLEVPDEEWEAVGKKYGVEYPPVSVQ